VAIVVLIFGWSTNLAANANPKIEKVKGNP